MAGELQTVYVDVPAVSYYAYPDDPNFVPEQNLCKEQIL